MMAGRDGGGGKVTGLAGAEWVGGREGWGGGGCRGYPSLGKTELGIVAKRSRASPFC